jgi:hypothetical protein
MLLDCSDQAMQDPQSKSTHVVLYSLHHVQTGAKFAVGCAPTGVVSHSWSSEAYPSRISDPNIVEASSIITLNLVPGDMFHSRKVVRDPTLFHVLFVEVNSQLTNRVGIKPSITKMDSSANSLLVLGSRNPCEWSFVSAEQHCTKSPVRTRQTLNLSS